MRKWAVRDVRRIAQHALLNGAVPVNPTRIAWDVSGDCLNSRYVEMWGRQEQRPKKLIPANMAEFSKILRDAPLYAGSLAIEMETRCRKSGTVSRPGLRTGPSERSMSSTRRQGHGLAR